RLAQSFLLVPRIAVVEAVLFAFVVIVRFLPLPQTAYAYINVISRLDFLFWVFLIWYGTITLFRSLRRISD
ncbi:MAG: hypothetical protein IKU24_06270, partial [Clostridia bacterium]|nr:hypothetical protein [Clostridia bacterium]